MTAKDNVTEGNAVHKYVTDGVSCRI